MTSVFFYTSKNKSSLKDLGVAVSGITMPFDNGTWVEFTTFLDCTVTATGVIVDYNEDAVTYTVQHYEGNKQVPAPSRYPVRDDPLMIRALPNMPPLRILPERAAAIEAEAKMSAAAKRP